MEQQENYIDLREIISIIKKRLPIIIACTLVFSLAAATISFFFMPDIYEASTTLYIGKQTDPQEQYLYQDLQMGQQIIKDYREIAKSKTVTRSVKDELKLEHSENASLVPILQLSDKAFSNKIEVNLKGDTRIIEIKVTDEDPVNCMVIANKTAEVFTEKVKDLLRMDNVQILDTAEQPLSPVRPNRMMNTAIGFLLGIMIGLAIVFLIEYLDNTIKTPDDVVKYTNLPVIGVIPRFEAVEDAKK